MPQGMQWAIGTLFHMAAQWQVERIHPRILVHCYAGASRSTATANMLLCAMNPDLGAERNFADLLKITNKPWPNRRIVEYAQTLFQQRYGRDMDMLAPLDAYRAQHPNRHEALMWHHTHVTKIALTGAQAYQR